MAGCATQAVEGPEILYLPKPIATYDSKTGKFNLIQGGTEEDLREYLKDRINLVSESNLTLQGRIQALETKKPEGKKDAPKKLDNSPLPPKAP